MVDWDGWRAVLLVARAGTVAAAAGELGVDATTAARRLRRLETRLALRLFERQGTRLVPTAACRDLLPQLELAERALAAAAAAFDGAAAGPVRTLRVTAVPFLVDHLLAPALPRLVAGRRLRVALLADNRNLILARREADLAVRLGRPEATHGAVRPLGTITYRVYSRAGGGERLPWAALSDDQAHLPESRWTARHAGGRGVEHRASRFETLARIAAAGLAQALLPDLVARSFPELVPAAGPPSLTREAWLVGHPEDADVPHVRAGIDWLCGLFAPAGEA
ncbi:LysR substrate-binding domain-containing protein [Stella sp.]|uniref:LysR substrate-binding domain-containing protein n=1 Tax=Stella sp. TaxID=2912054 RepID=UPI0035B28E53